MKTNKLFRVICFFVITMLSGHATAQDWINVHMYYDGGEWAFPYRIDHFSQFDFSEDGYEMRGYYNDADGLEQIVPFSVDYLDSITFVTEPDSVPKSPYKVYGMYITTAGGQAVASKEEYVDCYVSIDGRGEYKNYSGTARIRGRGNSTWLWYDKKPYRIKLDVSDKILGIKKNRDWVLLANYRDPTDMMNTYGFEAARWMGMPFTNNTRYVEVFLNGDYIGIYQLTEQVEQGGHRVDINEQGGVLLSFDLDDGPGLSPGATDNFYSEGYGMPMCVKYPDDPTDSVVAQIKSDFAILEKAVKAGDYNAVDSLMDIQSLIDMVQIQEYLYNVELQAPRSVYMFRDAGGKYTLGPVWDWDAGYDFDWNHMETNHNYFSNYKKLILGTDPLRQSTGVPRFFTDMFASKTFVERYKASWAERKDSIFLAPWAECDKFLEHLKQGAITREETRWPIGKNTLEEIENLKTWLNNRKAYLTRVIANYPVPEFDPVQTELRLCGTIKCDVTLSYAKGYGQSVTVDIVPNEVASVMGISTEELTDGYVTLVPLHRDGTEGPNNTNGVYGGWFNGDGNPYDHGQGHVYIEVFDDLFSWACGLRQSENYGWGGGAQYCNVGHSHTVTMQMRYAGPTETLAVNIDVTFTIAE